LAERLKILASAAEAWRRCWHDRRDIFRICWLPVLLSFLLLILLMAFPALKLPVRVAEKMLIAVFAVALFRKDLLGETPAFSEWAGIPFYFRFGRRETLYTLWTVALMLIAFLIGQAAAVANAVPYVGSFVGEQIWPVLRDALIAMLILVRPYIAVAPQPSARGILVHGEAVIGNIVNVMIAVLVISLPYYLMALAYPYVAGALAGFDGLWHGAEQALFCLCAIAQVKFAAAAYEKLAPRPTRRP
jgi:hypothetical protein